MTQKHTYRKTSILKVETDIITSIAVRPGPVILVTMSIVTFKSDITFFNGSLFDVTLTDNFQYQNQFVDNQNIIRRDKRKIGQITDRCTSLPKLFILLER